MTTLLSRAAQLTAGRCGSGGERDFVAELLWRTPRRLLCGRAQIGTDTISQRQRLRGGEQNPGVCVRPFLVHVVAVHLVCFVCHCTLRCASKRAGPCCFCRLHTPCRSPTHISQKTLYTHALTRDVRRVSIETHPRMRVLRLIRTNLRTHTSTQTHRITAGHHGPRTARRGSQRRHLICNKIRVSCAPGSSIYSTTRVTSMMCFFRRCV